MTKRHATSCAAETVRRGAIATSVRRAFTIFEMLITISIIILATAIVIPAFGRIIESSNFAAAVNTVTATLGNARALAIKNNQFTAVAFLFDTESETYSLLTLELFGEAAGSLTLYPSAEQSARAHSYRPAQATVPVELPKGVVVYGFTFLTEPAASLIDNGAGGIDPTRHWYAGELFLNSGELIRPWIFPRNDPRHFFENGDNPYDAIRAGTNTNDADTALRHAQSFMIQFSPEGTVVDSYPGAGIDHFTAYIEYPDLPQDEENGTIDPTTGEFPAYDDMNAFDPENRIALNADANAQENPEVVLRNVSQLAVVSVEELRRGVPELMGIRDVWFVRPADGTMGFDVAPTRADLEMAGTYYLEETTIAVSDWIDDNAEILSFNRYTGNIVRRAN